VSQCTNTELGKLLHNYELDLLSEEDRRRFEMHLYDCRHCLTQVQEFMDVARMIEHDSDARAIVSDIAGEADVGKSRSRKKSTTIIRFLIAAVIVVALAVPAYRYWLQPERTSVVQTLEFRPARTGGSDVVYLDKGGELEINFFVAEGYQGEVDLTITSVADVTVIDEPGFADINGQGLGSITLPVSTFTVGHYMLTIRPDPETGVPERVYMFHVK